MKKLLVFFVLAMGIGFFTHCNNDTDTIANGSDELTNRAVNSDCDYNTQDCDDYQDTIWVTPVLPPSINGVDIPDDLIEPGCMLGGVFTYWICPDNQFLFTDYQFIIPPECTALRDFLDGLDASEYAIVYDFLSSLVENMGMQIIIQNYGNSIPNTATVIANVYKPTCYKTCLECLYDSDEDDGGPQGMKNQNSINNAKRNRSVELRDGGKGKKPCENGTWVYTEIQCGTGCCETIITYEKNQYGVMIVTNTTVSASGGCEGGGPGGRCIGEIVVDCRYNCN